MIFFLRRYGLCPVIDYQQHLVDNYDLEEQRFLISSQYNFLEISVCEGSPL